MQRFSNIGKAIVAGAFVAIGALAAGSVEARPLEGDGVPVAGVCSRLERFVVGAPGSYPRAKVYAIAGLSGDRADLEFERIQSSIAERCS